METLSKLFSSGPLVKIMRLFLFNKDISFKTSEIARRGHLSTSSARRELSLLRSIKFIKHKNGSTNRNGRWTLNPLFPYLSELHALLIDQNLITPKEIERRLRKAGRLKLVLVAGVFIQNSDSRVDMLVVGDDIKRRVLDNAIQAIEAETGAELRYAVFETKEFLYRIGIYDKLVRDILDYPHEKLINRLNI